MTQAILIQVVEVFDCADFNKTIHTKAFTSRIAAAEWATAKIAEVEATDRADGETVICYDYTMKEAELRIG